MRERSGWNIETLVCWDIALLARMMLRLEVTTGSDMGERRGEDRGIAGKKVQTPPTPLGTGNKL